MINPIFVDRVKKMALEELYELHEIVTGAIQEKGALPKKSERERFFVGDHVYFHHKDRFIRGFVKRVNAKTLTVIPHDGPDGKYFRVPPSLLKHDVADKK